MAQEFNKAVFLWPGWSRIADGQIVLKTSGYEADFHWTGERIVGPENDLYWSWFFENRFIFPPVMDESLLPRLRGFWEEEIVSEGAIQKGLYPPQYGNFVFQANSSREVSALLASVFQRFGEDAFTPFTSENPADQFLRLLTVFCRGQGEIFCFRGGKCDLFLAVGENSEALPRMLAMIEKRFAQPRHR